jgi:hypothetical protein
MVMNQYIENLTDNLIRRHHFDADWEEMENQDREKFLKQIKDDLDDLDVCKMKPETLGRVMCSIELGNVMASKEDLFQGVCFAGQCGDLLRDLVSLCLAYIIRERILATPDIEATGLIPYRG